MAVTAVDTTLQNVAEVLEWYSKKGAANAIKTSNALLAFLEKKGKIRKMDGGRKITERVILKKDANFKWYSGMDALSNIQSDAVREASFEWRQASGAVMISGLDLRNASSSKFSKSNLLQDVKNQVETTIREGLGTALWNTTAPASGEAERILSIPDVVKATGSVGGLDTATYPLWSSTVLTSVKTVAASTGSELLELMEELFNTIFATSGMRPDLVISNSAVYTKYGRACQELKRFSSETKYRADIGFAGYDFNGAFFVLDGKAPTNELYMLNTEDFALNVHSDAYFTATPMRMREDEDAYFSRVLFQGQLSVSNRKTHGKIAFAADAS